MNTSDIKDQLAFRTELCVGIARRLHIILDPLGERKGQLWTMGTSDFEHAFILMRDLGLAEGIPAESTWPSWFRVLSEVSIRSVMQNEGESIEVIAVAENGSVENKDLVDGAKPSNRQIFNCYLSVACDYGPNNSSLSQGDNEFVFPPEFEKEVEVLLDNGFLERRKSLIAWTEKKVEWELSPN